MEGTLPAPSISDTAHLGARMAIAAIPLVGGPALELFNAVIAPPLLRRRDAFLNVVIDRLNRLEQEPPIKYEQLAEIEEFVSTVVQACRIAVQNHEQEKIDALRNAALNAAVGLSPVEWKRALFLNFVEVFTVPHLSVLKALADSDAAVPRRTAVENAVPNIARHAAKLVPALSAQPKIAELIVEDLCRKGLLFWNEIYISRDAKQVSQLGSEFLRFISEPTASSPEK